VGEEGERYEKLEEVSEGERELGMDVRSVEICRRCGLGDVVDRLEAPAAELL
jgi:hypothetical protein